MEFKKAPVNRRVVQLNRWIEKGANFAIRSYDGVMGRLHLGGRRAAYDDLAYEFVGGAKDKLRAKHYDKSLRLLWKAEQHAPWSSFRDLTPAEKKVAEHALRELNPEEIELRERIAKPEFSEMLKQTYTPEQRAALVSILSTIGHGEAYAWLVSAELLGQLKSTGAKAAATMQVIEEAKHFVVLRELILAFDVSVPRLSAWEYLLLESALKAKGLEKFFGMNVLVEGVALSIFGLLSHLPGLEILRLFHLDESRHTALPINYFSEFDMSRWQKINPIAQLRRLRMIMPAIPMVFHLEEAAAELGIDIFEFTGSVLRKVLHLAQRAGYKMVLPPAVIASTINLLLNAYCLMTHPAHEFRDFTTAETTVGADQRAVEAEVFGLATG